MAIDELQADLKANLLACKKLSMDPEVTPRQVMQHLQNSLWPFIEAHVEETVSQSEIMDEIVEETGDILQAETAGVFAAVLLSAEWALEELRKHVGPSNTDTLSKMSVFATLCREASDTLEAITVDTNDDDDDDDDVEQEVEKT